MHLPNDVALIVFGVAIVSDVGPRHVRRVLVAVFILVASVLNEGCAGLVVGGGVVLALLGQVGCAPDVRN